LIRERLQQDGYTEAELSRVHMPIGLPIGSETPAEIAVSILGEMVAVRRKGGNKVK
jgi:xanthine dehydrogenase accessory factor